LLAEFPQAHCILAHNSQTNRIRRSNFRRNSPLHNKARHRLKLRLKPFRPFPPRLSRRRNNSPRLRFPCTLARL
jgi:hypothetical protein